MDQADDGRGDGAGETPAMTNLYYEQERRHLELLVFRLRQIAAPVGSMHSYWDVVSDIKAFLQGKPTLVQKTQTEWVRYAWELLETQP